MEDNERKYTNNEIVEDLYRKRTVRKLINRMDIEPIDKDDLESEILVILLNYDNDKLNEAYQNKWKGLWSNQNAQIKNVIALIARNLYYSTSSKFWKKYRRFRKQTKELAYDSDDKKIQRIIEEMTPNEYDQIWERRYPCGKTKEDNK